jgi:hypothetical protein|tara:strand:- start:233 stop:1135 length:903 start_codon:yes stop_codon:yes gene_type:complete
MRATQGSTDVPAHRSRTTGWRRCLEQICQRNGSIEIAIEGPEGDAPGGGDLLFRSRVLHVAKGELWLEPPTALGEAIEIESGMRLVGIMAIGQNRWMFRTTCAGATSRSCGGGMTPVLVVEMPHEVERCQRRRDYRINTSELALPDVTVWPLLDADSVVLAERVNEAEFLRERDAMESASMRLPSVNDEDLLPDVGPSFSTRLVNLGGGGIGLNISMDDAGAFNRARAFWVRFELPPHVLTPVCATARMVHSHIQSDKRMYAGMTFDFSHNPSHKRFVVQQIVRAIAGQQKRQLARRRSA